MRLTSLLVFASLLAACGGSTTSDTSSTAPTNGQAGAGGGAAGSSVGGNGGTAGSVAGSAGQGQPAAGAAGKATAGAGGTAAGSGGSPAKAGASGTGAGGSPAGCCKVDFACGDVVYEPCINGVCKPTVQGKCWSNVECKPTEQCVGASVCPCGALCGEADAPGTCQSKALPQDFTICNAPGDCVLAEATCCGACGVPKASDKVAVLASKVGALSALMCAPGEAQSCPDCIYGKNADLAGFCLPDSGEVSVCGVVEVSKHKVSDCDVDADCTMHLDKCCDCGTGAPTDYVALSNAGVAIYEANICGPGKGGCAADCTGMHPAGYGATCDQATKHCKISKL